MPNVKKIISLPRVSCVLCHKEATYFKIGLRSTVQEGITHWERDYMDVPVCSEHIDHVLFPVEKYSESDSNNIDHLIEMYNTINTF